MNRLTKATLTVLRESLEKRRKELKEQVANGNHQYLQGKLSENNRMYLEVLNLLSEKLNKSW